jgi:SsrA-binding protein
MAQKPNRPVASNRRARHDYAILDTIEAGLVLRGSEVKSIREGLVQLGDAFVRFDRGEAWLEGMHVSPYSMAVGYGAHDPDRRRKLLLNRAEIQRWSDRVHREHLAVIPLSVYFTEGRAKVELALARGRRKEDKRQALAERDAELEMQKAVGRDRKGRPRPA